MKIVTYSNVNNIHQKRFIGSSKKNGIYPVILGQNDAAFSYLNKVKALREYLLNCPPEEIILFTDCWDVIILSGENEIIEKFRSFNRPVVFSTEKILMTIKRGDECLKQWPAGIMPYRWLSSGGFIGYAEAILGILNALHAVNYYDISDDQSIFYCYFLDHPDELVLDYKQEIFGNNSGVQVSNFRVKRVNKWFKSIFTKKFGLYDEFRLTKEGAVYNTNTGQKCLLLHCPGQNYFRLDFLCWQKGYPHFLYAYIPYVCLDRIGINLCILIFFYILPYICVIPALMVFAYYNQTFYRWRRDNLGRKLFRLWW